MYRPLEHDYIGLSSPPPTMESQENPLKTELSLGLPGSSTCGSSSERKVTIFGKDLELEAANGSPKIGSLGAKRGFADTIDGSKKWVLSVNGGRSELCAEDGVGALYSPRKVSAPSTPKNHHVVAQETKPLVNEQQQQQQHASAPSAKAQVVGWPPVRSFRKNTMASALAKNNEQTDEKSGLACLYVKVSMDGAPYLRKVDLQIYRNYMEMSSALEKMFSCFITGHRSDGQNESRRPDHLQNSEFVLTYEDKDGDWMLVGDVPWKMFKENCRKLRIMKGSEAIGLAPKCS